MGCNIKFKTKKQKLIHHNKMEPECKIERNSLIKLLKHYKQLAFSLWDKLGVVVNEDEEIQQLKSCYNDVEKKLLDVDYFRCLLGKKFEDPCPNVTNEDEEFNSVEHDEIDN
jgi:hypothetical protein